MSRRSLALLLTLICSSSSLGCKKGGGRPPEPGMDASVDAGLDASMDASTDASTDASMDGTMCELTMCPTGCADLDTDPQNCGSCGNMCTAPTVCVGGLCVDPP